MQANHTSPFRASLSRQHVFIVFVSAVLWVLYSVINHAVAHEMRPALVDLSFDQNGIYQLRIQHDLEGLLTELNTPNADTEKQNEQFNALRVLPPEQLNAEFEKNSRAFLQNVNLIFYTKGDRKQREPLRILDIEVPEVGDTEVARDSVINFAGIIPTDAKKLSFQWPKNYGDVVFRVGSNSQPELFNGYLSEGAASELVPFTVDCYDGKNAKKVGGCQFKQSQWGVFKNYILVGFDHIIPKGLDHILFVIGLFLLTTQLRPLLIQVTCFTLAHSVTLALGIYGVVKVSPSIVEPLIAASIVYVCLENIYSDKLTRWRPLVIIAFGLLHGLGFASVLTDFGLSSGSFLTSLVGFNIGVELGQLTVIALCFLLVGIWFRHKPWYRQRITIPASIIIALIAIYWVLERTGMIGA